MVEKGNDLTVRVNGAVLGGVLRLTREQKRWHRAIREFLTDVPVGLIPTEKYIITIELYRDSLFPFDEPVEALSVESRERVETYSRCAVERVESAAEGRGEAAYTVVVTARERSVLNE